MPKIYTRTGDDGTTGLFGGRRVPKDDLRIETYGTVDELNALLGVARAQSPDADLDAILQTIQEELFLLGADLATPIDQQNPSVPRMEKERTAGLERMIDRTEQTLEPLRFFILPGGHPCAAHLHHARTVCRRAERLAVRLAAREPLNPAILPYLNRLSDLLFVLARAANRSAGREEIRWHS